MILEISEREGEKRMHTKTESILKEGMTVHEAFLRLRGREAGRAPMWQAKERAKQIRRWFPKEAEQTIVLADQAMEGMLVLSGTGPEPYFVGNPPSGRKIPAAIMSIRIS